MKSTTKSSKIVTFYSYKGGVGRTMSLANVAFLAAVNKQRVLVMDWDMEAPGLVYYFRGLQTAAEAKKLKDSKGILDIFWDWCNSLKNIQKEEEVEDLFGALDSGSLFADCVMPLMSTDLIDGVTKLDYIGAGGQFVGVLDKVPYEEALARFSWAEFFETYGGGAVLESLKVWAKKNYDLILIDSRTGFADVAGICTMQMPDEVALCFVLNRQNIDGIARVSAAIREQREDKVRLRAVPMRVARGESAEGSDAKARAITELTKIGGFSTLAVQEDIKNLGILSSDDLPSYETLAPFASIDPGFDPLTWNYAKLASEILGFDLQVPTFNSDMLSLVKMRLQPRHATVEFLEGLTNGEPERAFAELQLLVESAYEAIAAGEELDSDYAKALIDVSSAVAEMADDLIEAMAIRGRALDLLRSLALVDSDSWKLMLISKLGESLEYSFGMDSEDMLAILEELDVLLSEYASLAHRLKRIDYRRRTIWIYLSTKQIESAGQVMAELVGLLRPLREATFAPDQRLELVGVEVDLLRMQAEVATFNGDLESAMEHLKAGLIILDEHPVTEELLRHKFDMHLALVEMPPLIVSGEEAATHAMAAAASGVASHRVIYKFTQLADALMRGDRNVDRVLDFCDVVIKRDESRTAMYVSNFYGRYPALAVTFFKSVRNLLGAVISAQDFNRAQEIAQKFSDICSMIMKSLIRRRQALNEKHKEQIEYELDMLKPQFERLGVYLEPFGSAVESKLSRHFLGGENN